MALTLALPRYAALKTNYNSKFLRYINEDVETKNHVQYSGDDVITTFTKYELEPAKIDKGLVNIRCCYNNKYWVSASETSHYVVASADKPEEDKSKWSCTLFQPTYDSSNGTYRFKHVNLEQFVFVSKESNETFKNCLIVKSDEEDDGDLHVIIDWESLTVLPKYVAFKGHNGKYLKASWMYEREYLKYFCDDIGDWQVRNQVFTLSDGSVRFKLLSNGYFWNRNDNWILANSLDTTASNRNTVFWPVKVSKNVVALRNSGNDRYCRRVAEGENNCIAADDITITNEDRMEIQEPILSRDIYNVNFRVEDGRVYGENILTLATGEAVNNHPESDEIAVELTYSEETTKTWESSTSMKLGAEISISAGIPFIESSEIKISGEYSESHTWGESSTTSTSVKTSYNVKVPPMSKVKVYLLATKGSCDVPFSYTQRDTRIDGETVIEEYDDGVYVGANYYHFKYQTDDVVALSN